MLKDYYQGVYNCIESSCGMKTHAYINCQHSYKADKISEKGVADTLNYLDKLFDVDDKQKGIKDDQKRKIKDAIEPYTPIYDDVNKKIKTIRDHNAYDIIELKNVFSFMNVYNKTE